MNGTFRVILIKPARYDDEGYVVQWRRAVYPSNSLSTLNGLAEGCAARRVLGPDVEIVVEVYDDQCGLPSAEAMAARIKAASAGGLVGIVGAHSAQFPRGADLARRFRAAGVPVIIGGFHVSGCLATLPAATPELREMLDLGVSLFVGEAEGRLERVLRDAHTGRMEPIYDYSGDLIDLDRAEPPSHLPANVERRLALALDPVDPIEAGRGCPFNCTFCSVINVHGRSARARSAETMAEVVRNSVARGRTRFLFTDDNFSRNRNWREILEALARLREEEGLKFSLMFQVDTQSDRDPDFIPLAVRAGCAQAFVGVESIHPDALAVVGKKHNTVERYQRFFLTWKRHGVVTMAGYIVGFPNDTRKSVLRDLELIKRELPIDLFYPFILTPLPGSADHAALWQKGALLDPDLSRYTTCHATTPHPRMSGEELEALYHEAWRIYYDDAHTERILRRHVGLGGDLGQLFPFLLVARSTFAVEKIHPFEVGLFRIKVRNERRPDRPLEPLLPFLACRAWTVLSAQTRWAWHWLQLKRLARRAERYRDRPEMDDPALGGAPTPEVTKDP